MRAAATTSLALVAVAVSACAGPKAPYDVGTQAAPVNLVLGAKKAVAEAPVGPVSVPPPPGLGPLFPLPDLDKPVVTRPTLGPQEPCPTVDKLTPVFSRGTPIIPGPPHAGTYVYRGAVTDTVGKSSTTYKGDSSWKVTASPPDAVTGNYHVTLETTFNKTTTRRVLLVVPKGVGGEVPLVGLDGPGSTDPNVQVIDAYNSTVGPYGLPLLPRNLPNLGRIGPAGIYLESQQSGSSTFKPTVPMPLLQLPLGANTFTAVGSDGVTAMTYKSTVRNPRGTINACGKKVEAVQVEITEGFISSLTEQGQDQVVRFSQTLHFGLQFGGLPLRDRGHVFSPTLPGGTPALDKIERTFDFTVNSVPKLVKS